MTDGIANLPADAAQAFPGLVPVDNPNQTSLQAGIANVGTVAGNVAQTVTSTASQVLAGATSGASGQLTTDAVLFIVGAIVVLMLVNKAEAL